MEIYRNLRFFILINYLELLLTIYRYIMTLPFRFPYRIIKKSVRKKKLKKLENYRFRKYCEYLPDIISEPYFVKIGAYDGITYDPCSDLLLNDKRWKGLLIEPLNHAFEKLKLNFNDNKRFQLVKTALGGFEGEKKFYYIDPNTTNVPLYSKMIGSFNINHILKHKSGEFRPFILEGIVRVSRLGNLLERYSIKKIDLLHIDAESHDYEILKTLNFDEYIPAIILIEYNHLSKEEFTEMENLLTINGYELNDCGIDIFALNKEAYYGLS